MPSRLRGHGLVDRGGHPVASPFHDMPRTIVQPTTKPHLQRNETLTGELPGGLQVGDFWPYHDGGYRLCRAEEDLELGKATFWAGPEEGRTSAAGGTKTIVAANKGDDAITVETVGNYGEDAFSGGMFRMTGGTAAVAGRYYNIAHSEASEKSNEISGASSGTYYKTKLILTRRINVAIDQDTDWHIQGNVFDCQRNAPGNSLYQIPTIRFGETSATATDFHYRDVARIANVFFMGVTATEQAEFDKLGAGDKIILLSPTVAPVVVNITGLVGSATRNGHNTVSLTNSVHTITGTIVDGAYYTAYADNGSADLDQPKLHVGIPRVPVKAGEYFWNQVSGPAQAQLFGNIGATDCVSGKVDLYPYPGNLTNANWWEPEDVAQIGQLQATSLAAATFNKAFARLNVRAETAFLNSPLIPVWLYGNAGV